MTLRRKMAHGAIWSLVGRGGQQGLSFLVFMFLARLVGPEEYGLANICFVYFLLANLLISGMVDGVVSLQLDKQKQISSLFWGVMGLGMSLSILCWATAIPLAMALEQPRLVGLLMWFGVIPILIALSSIPSLMLIKSLDFKTYAIRTLVATVIGGIVGVVMAMQGAGAYAIVGQQVMLYLIINVIVWLSISWRPQLSFSFAELRVTTKPGLGSMWLNAAFFLDDQLPRLVIAKFAGPVALGYYALAIRLQNAINETLVSPPLAVVFPAFASIKSDISEQQKLCGQILTLVYGCLLPVLAIAAATAPVYVPLFFGGNWAPAAPLLQVFILLSAFWPLSAVISQVFRAHGQLALYFRVKLAVSVLIIMSLPLLAMPNGLMLFALSLSVIALVNQPVGLYFLHRWLGINLWRNILGLTRPVIVAVLGFVVVYGVDMTLQNSSNEWIRLGLELVAGMATCLIAAMLIMRPEIRAIKEWLKYRKLRMTQTSGISS